MKIEPIQLPQQICVVRNGNAPTSELMLPVTNAPYCMKPNGGIWTSTFDPEYVCSWHRWCVSEMPDWINGKSIYTLEPVSAKVYVIDCRTDLLQLTNKYGLLKRLGGSNGWRIFGLDFESMVRDGIDAVHLTEAGEWQTRYGGGMYSLNDWNLYGWDCESTIWLKWCFQKVEFFGTWNAMAAAIAEKGN